MDDPKMTHTPGPWEYTRYHFSDAQGGIYMPNAEGACTIQLTGAASMTQEQLDANGKLIAAAPDLLEAAKSVIGMHIAVENGTSDLKELSYSVTDLLEAVRKAESH